MALAASAASAQPSELAARHPAMGQAVKIYMICVATKLRDLGFENGSASDQAEAIIPLCSTQYRNIVFSYVNDVKPEIRNPVAQRMMADERSFAIRTILRLRKPSAPAVE